MGLYTAQVVSQADDGTLTVTAEDPRQPPLTGVSVSTLVPGLTLRVAFGTQVAAVVLPSGPIANVYHVPVSAIETLTFTNAAGASVTLSAAGDIVLQPAAGRSVLLGGPDGPGMSNIAVASDPVANGVITAAPTRLIKAKQSG